MNYLVSNRRAEHLKTLPAGRAGSQNIPFKTDASGRLILSPSLTVPIEAEDLDIRPLSSAQDSALITGTDIDARPLSGTQDSVTIAQANYASANASSSVALFPVFLLTRDISPYKTNIFRVETPTLSVLITVQLQIAPIDNDDYYVADGGQFSLLFGDVVFLQPTRLMRYARVRASGGLTAGTVNVQYFGRV